MLQRRGFGARSARALLAISVTLLSWASARADEGGVPDRVVADNLVALLEIVSPGRGRNGGTSIPIAPIVRAALAGQRFDLLEQIATEMAKARGVKLPPELRVAK